MARPTRGERNNNPGNIERSAANKWQGRLSDADYRQTAEARQNGGRFDVFYQVEFGIRALAVLLVAYQDRHGLRTLRGIIGRWAPSAETSNDTSAYVDHVAELTGFGPDTLLDLHSYAHLAPVVKAIITHENGRCVYGQAQIDDGLVRAGIAAPSRAVVSKAADRAKTTVAVAAGGTVTVAAAVDIVQQVAPALPVVQQVASLPPMVLIVAGVVAAVGLIAWLVLRRK
ncbi:structural protein [Inquilinus sp.]|uniref:structural protein n=1 Tax=Inquilinus sp. TaxID=1932117 RepID=UPI0031D999BA